MVKRILTFLNKEFNGVNEAALLLGSFAFISQLLGMVRDRTLAHVVGAGPVLDVYYAAFRIPDFLYISIASLASVTVLMPFLMNKMHDSTSKDAARAFLNNIFSAYMMFMVVVSGIVAFCMPYLAHYIAPGFTEAQLASLVTVSRIMLLSPIFIGLSNLIGTITQLFKNFFVFSLSPIFYNIGIITGIVFLYPYVGVYGLAYGVIIGALLHLLIQIPTVMSRGFMPSFVSRINWREIYEVVKVSAPRTFTLSCNSLAFMVLIALASTVKPGSISLFTFSYNLQSVPVGIIGISYSVAAFPVLIRAFVSGEMDKFLSQILATARQVIFWSLPVITLIIVLRAQIVRVILGSNTFSWPDTRLTAAAVALFMISLASQSLVLLFVRGYYAAGNTKKPLMVNTLSSMMVIIFAYTLIHIFGAYPSILVSLESLLRVKDVPGTLMLVLPLAYALGSLLNFGLIWVLFKRDFLHGMPSGLFTTFIQSTISACIMGIVAYGALDIFDNVFSLSTGRGVFLQGFCSGIFGISAGILVLYLLKNQELHDLAITLRKKFWRNRILAPEQGEL